MMSWRRFLQRRQRDEELAREIESYIAHEVDDNIARGMSRDAALHAARRQFGNTTAVREAVYEMNGLSLVESVWQDIRLGLRQLRRNPAFACSGILILALGIGATTVIFSVAYGVLLRDLPYDQPQRGARRQTTWSAAAGAALIHISAPLHIVKSGRPQVRRTGTSIETGRPSA